MNKKCKICKRPLTGNENVCPECKNIYGTGMVVGVGIIGTTIVRACVHRRFKSVAA